MHAPQLAFVYLVAAKMSSNFFFSTWPSASGQLESSCGRKGTQSRSQEVCQISVGLCPGKPTRHGKGVLGERVMAAASGKIPVEACTSMNEFAGSIAAGADLVHKDHVLQHSLAHAHELRHNPARVGCSVGGNVAGPPLDLGKPRARTTHAHSHLARARRLQQPCTIQQAHLSMSAQR